MFAVIKTGGKQYRVAANDVLKVEKLPGNAGDTVNFDAVLMLGGDNPVIGDPYVAGASVAGEILEQTRDKKILVFKKKRRKKYRRTKGHRQYQTIVRVTDILARGASLAPGAEADKAAAKPAAGEDATDANVAGDAAAAGGNNATDDLSLISGVGPVLVKKLNDAGYTRFAQLAALSETQMAQLDEELELQGRSGREEWAEQARELMAGKAPRAKVDQQAVAQRAEDKDGT